MSRPFAEIKVWLIDDCDYIAAATAEEAIAYEIRECFTLADGTVDLGHEITAEGPIDPTGKMYLGEPGDADEEHITLAEAIYRHGQAGGTFPHLLASTEY